MIARQDGWDEGALLQAFVIEHEPARLPMQQLEHCAAAVEKHEYFPGGKNSAKTSGEMDKLADQRQVSRTTDHNAIGISNTHRGRFRQSGHFHSYESTGWFPEADLLMLGNPIRKGANLQVMLGTKLLLCHFGSLPLIHQGKHGFGLCFCCHRF